MKLAVLFCLVFILLQPLEGYYYDIQARVGAYYPTCHQAREAFQRGIPVYELEGSCFFSNPWEWVPWKFWVNGSYMTGSGHAERLGRTHSNMSTLSLGLKHSWRIDCYGEFYLGAGPSLSWLRMKTHEVKPEGFWDGHWHGHRKISKKQAGGVLKSGFQLKFWEGRLLIDVFGDYLITAFHYKNLSKRHLHHAVPAVNKIHKHSRKEGHHRLDISGFKVGGAIGFPF